MEQSRRRRAHLERILLVAGAQHAGKSTLLRQMFVDARLGTGGVIPTEARIRPVALSRERCLVVRCSSPHERGETLAMFLRKLDRAMERAWRKFWRFNFACAVQPHAVDPTPDLVAICAALQDLKPERVRIVQIHPRQDGEPGELLAQDDIDRLRELEIEVLTVDGHRSARSSAGPNGLLLADFFDFT